MKKPRRVAAVALMFALALARLSSQTPPQKPSFDVVSIKPSAPLGNGPIRIGGGTQGDRFTMNSATLRMLLQTAYQSAGSTPLTGRLEIIGGPGWMDSDRYDVQAKADCSGGMIPRETLQLMMRSLLEDRFQLKAHLETRELPIYNLVLAKDGPKIKRSADQTPPAVAAAPPGPCEPATANPPPPFPGGRGNPFAPRVEPSPPPAAPAPQVQGPPPGPQVPPVPYRFVGKVTYGGNSRVALTAGDRIHLVVEGDAVDGGYVVRKITEDKVTLAYTPFGVDHELALVTEASVPTPAPIAAPAQAPSRPRYRRGGWRPR